MADERQRRGFESKKKVRARGHAPRVSEVLGRDARAQGFSFLCQCLSAGGPLVRSALPHRGRRTFPQCVAFGEVMTANTSSHRACHGMVMCIMARDASNHCAFDASFGLCGIRHADHRANRNNRKDKLFHGKLL